MSDEQKTDPKLTEVVAVIKRDLNDHMTADQTANLERAKKKRDEWKVAYPAIQNVPNLTSILAYCFYRFDGIANAVAEEVLASDDLATMLGMAPSPIEEKVKLLYTRLVNNILNAERGKAVYVLGKGRLNKNKTFHKGQPDETTGNSVQDMHLWLITEKTYKKIPLYNDQIDAYEPLEVGKAYKIQMNEGRDGRIFLDKAPLHTPIEYNPEQLEIVKRIREDPNIPELTEPFDRILNSNSSYFSIGTISKSPDGSLWDFIPIRPVSASLMIGGAGRNLVEGDSVFVVGRLAPAKTKGATKEEREVIPNTYTIWADLAIPIKRSKAQASEPQKPQDASATPPAEGKAEVPQAVKEALGI